MMIRKTSFILAAFALAACGGGESTTSTSTGNTTSSGGSTSTGTGGEGGGGAPPVLETLHVSTADAADKPLANFHVFTSDADGHVVKEADTDANGVVQLDVPAGGSISALEDEEIPDGNGGVYSGRAVHTIYDVPDGGTVRVRVPDPASFVLPPAPNDPMPTVTYYVPNVPPATASVVISASCHFPEYELPVNGTGLYAMTNYAGCAGASTFDVVIRCLDANRNTLAWSVVKDAPFMSGQTSNTEVDVDTAQPANYAATITNVPPNAKVSASILAGRTPTGNTYRELSEILKLTTMQPTSPLDFNVAVPSDVYDHWYMYTQVFVGMNTWVTYSQHALQTQPPSPFTMDVDAVAHGVPQKPDVTDPLHPVLSFQFDGANLGDAVSVQFDWGQSKSSTTWDVLLPPADHGSVRFPDLPAVASSWAFQSAADSFDALYAAVVDAKSISSYSGYLDRPAGEQDGYYAACFSTP